LMRFEAFAFGSIRIDGVSYEHDVVIEHGHVHKRQKKPSRNSATNSATPRSRSRKRFPGLAGGS
jgi:hypothetical protein